MPGCVYSNVLERCSEVPSSTPYECAPVGHAADYCRRIGMNTQLPAYRRKTEVSSLQFLDVLCHNLTTGSLNQRRGHCLAGRHSYSIGNL